METPLSVNGLLLAVFTLFAVILTFARQIRLMFEDAVKYSDIIAQQKKEIDRLRKEKGAEMFFERGKGVQQEAESSSGCVS